MLTAAFERFGTTPAAGQRRAIGLNLVLFFLLALAAVWFLTRTAVAANAINRDVASAIEPAFGSIDSSTSHLSVLDTTVQLTGEIATAAKPLSGRLDGVVAATGRIDSNLRATGTDVTAIGASVDGIKHSTGSIAPGISVLAGHVRSIHGDAAAIAADFSSIDGLTSSIVRNLSGAEASLARVQKLAGPLGGSVRSIHARVPQINDQAAKIAASPLLLRNPLQLQALLGDILAGS